LEKKAMWIPKGLYDLMPYICLIMGGISILKAANALMFASGAVLAFTGAGIWKLRRQGRPRKNAKFNRM
jgi:hypothetical protein